MWPGSFSIWVLHLSTLAFAFHYDPRYVEHNLNQKKDAHNAVDYWGQWENHAYEPSPKNWRFPFYTIFLDRFVNGDPTNDNINGTFFEHDTDSTQLRHGGDLQGLVDTLDYLHGMGIKGLYIAGSPFINQPWGYDQYSPLDLTILEPHFGTLDLWQHAITEIHARGMYVILDNTFATLGDLIGFDGYLNTTTPFETTEHQVQWKGWRQYWDFEFGNDYNETCNYPQFYNESGWPVEKKVTDRLHGCYNSEFDQYGDTEAFGVYPNWRRELTKFASVQDRLREWHPPVREKLENFYCMLIAQLDIDGLRYDKAVQSTVQPLGQMNKYIRSCARKHGKENFFLPGEVTGGNEFGSVYIGRGRQLDMFPNSTQTAATLHLNSSEKYFMRGPEHGALDSAAFHYTVWRTLTRFLGMDGNLAAGYDAPLNWVDQWNTYLVSNDFINANTGEFDPRHMFGITNQDVFRWPALTNGVQRQLLGHFITTILMPGVPLILWGEEQEFYILDSIASNYIFGRQPMSSATAWETHGCFHLPSTQFYEMPLDSAKRGCEDSSVSLDHRDPTAPVRNILKHMFNLREALPVLNDGFYLQQLSNHTWNEYYPGSSGVATETGMWSVLRSGIPGIQEMGKDAFVWLLFSNLNVSKTYEFDCDDKNDTMFSKALIAPFHVDTVVKNLFPPYDTQTLDQPSTQKLYINGATRHNGCMKKLDMMGYDFRAYVPIEYWVGPEPMITKFYPGHDARILSKVDSFSTEDVQIELHFNVPMSCASVTRSIRINSTTEINMTPVIDLASVKCGGDWRMDKIHLPGAVQSVWAWTATLRNVANGVHSLTVNDAETEDLLASTGTNDRFLFRVGQYDNPMVFTRQANYSSSLLLQLNDGTLLVNHSAAGADQWRYSTNFRSSFTDWMRYEGGIHELEKLPWSGTDLQAWDGEHVLVEYWSRLSGSSSHVQQADIGSKARRFPHLHLSGPYNYYGYDAGLASAFELKDDFTWHFPWMQEWTLNGSVAQINVWGMNPDGQPDSTYILGDIDSDGILDRLPPDALAPAVLNITMPPPWPHLSWTFVVNDGGLRFQLMPTGSLWNQLVLYILLATIPIVFGSLSCWAFMRSFYKVKFNEVGISSDRHDYLPLVMKRPFSFASKVDVSEKDIKDPRVGVAILPPRNSSKKDDHKCVSCLQKYDALQTSMSQRRKVLIATMEYDIEDWAIKVKIGGLGVMAQLMGKNLGHQDLIWVIPCVGGIDYPTDTVAEPMLVTILGTEYEVNVQYHVLRNITYVLLDAPVFRQQTKSEPYPARMDDMMSAIYYSAWNQCIAQSLVRFDVDLYHINDYHGTIAPLYLLPRTFPICLSLHNAEFQGLWPMRTKEEKKEVCAVFNLPEPVVQQFVQFGEIFNLLHAGASLLRVWQEGFGAVGVSKKYGKRAYARYPIFWGLQSVQGLPNPDPTDTGEWDKKLPKESDMKVDPAFEKERLQHRLDAQKWAGLEEDPTAELFVFVGRWSNQKGVDLIADCFPAVLESNKKVQLICVGPVIDLYGKFAALKLDRLMKLYPKRVYSKPEFTALPPYIFSGAEFALIPSRDEPFGLVAVEFGRKGALGVGARVGGLGQMPGWWFTVESMTTEHLQQQFREAIHEAMASPTSVRAKMRARSAKQRFPVAQWVEDLEILQSTSIRVFNKVKLQKRPDSSTETLTELRDFPLIDVEDHSDPTDVQPEEASTVPTRLLSPQPSPVGGTFPDQARSLQPSPVGSTFPDRPRSLRSVSAASSRPGTADSGRSYVSEESRAKSFNFSRPHDTNTYKKATFGTKHGPGHIEREDYNDGVAFSGLDEGKFFLPPNMTGLDLHMSSAENTKYFPGSWQMGYHSSSASGPSSGPQSDSGGEDDHDRTSVVMHDQRSITTPARTPRLVLRDSFESEYHDVDEHDDEEHDIDGHYTDDHYADEHDELYSDEDHESRHELEHEDDSEDDVEGTGLVDHEDTDADILDTDYVDTNADDQKPSRWPLRLPSLTKKHPAAEAIRQRNPRISSVDLRAISTFPPPPPVPEDAVEERPKPTRSMISMDSVVGTRNDFKLQKVDPFFTDSNGHFYEIFRKKLESLDKNNSETSNCIEEFLIKSEKQWFNDYRNAKLGRLSKPNDSRPSSIGANTRPNSAGNPLAKSRSLVPSLILRRTKSSPAGDSESQHSEDEFLLGENYKPPTGLRKWMQIRVFTWPVYAYFMALGQIIAANSYQITLLTGEVGQTAPKLYSIASVYLASSMIWWLLFRRFPAVLVLSLPFAFYGSAFFLVGAATFSTGVRAFWIQNLGTGFYAIASSSGAFFFSLNFGDEGGAQVKLWILRACIIQGTQQIYVVALWLWGSVLTRRTVEGVVMDNNMIAGTWKIVAITFPIAVFFWAIGLIMAFGLPTYYRQVPGKMPSFYRSLLRRNVVLWFFLTACVQNFFLSAPYGRNWTFLFSSMHASPWQILVLALIFFIGVWAFVLWIFGRLTKKHSWILPLFAIGLGAPRWAQIWWGTSGIGLYLPWAGGYTWGALVSRMLWLWLGVLDSIQGVGIGMIMLGTLTRIHVACAIVITQVLGSVFTMVARAVAPNRIGPGPISPDISGGLGSLWTPWFWVGLVCNLLLCVGFYKFYRKEQLLKP